MDLDRAFILWANEEQYYDINRNKCSGICGHYTQIVWEKSKFV
jgi:pathogenesis-related protein 1